jgi:hypothetical protein
VVAFAVGRADDIDHRPGRRGRVGAGRDRVVPGRVEDSAIVVASREPQGGEDADGLVPDRLDAVDDGRRFGVRMLQRALQVVQDRQPARGHAGGGLCLGLADAGRAPLAHVVGLRQCPQPLILRLGELGAQVVAGRHGRLILRGGAGPVGRRRPGRAGARLTHGR